MVEITDTHSGQLSSVQWMTAVAFLGAVYCVVLGIFKRFTANFSLGGRSNDESGAVKPRMGVYRNVEYTTYAQINEVPAQSSVGYPKTEVKPRVSTGNNAVSNTSITPMPKLPVVQGIKEKKKQAAPEIPKASTPPVVKPKKTAPPKPTNEKDENVKIQERLKKEKAAQLKQDKKLLEKKANDEKAKKEKEKKDKKEKEKKDKPNKGKAPLKPAAGAIADKPMNNPIAAAENVPPPMFLNVNKQGPVNTTGSLQELSAKPAAVNTGFTSSWDLVAEHRQNMQRELQTTNPGRNLRSIASQNTELKKEVNMASNTPSRAFNISQRYSGGSDMSNTDA